MNSSIDNNRHTLVIEGSIGAGKSTFLSLMNKYLDINPVFEPVDQWQNVGGGQNLLQKFYEDTARWAYTFQTFAFVTRVVQQNNNLLNGHPVQVLERSVYSDRYVFAKNCFEMGLMSALEWQLYQDWFTWLVDNYTHRPTGFIYLRTSPEVCYERIKLRERSAESSISLDYLKRLHDKHEQWLIERQQIASWLSDVPVLVLSCDNDFENNASEQMQHMDSINAAFGVRYRQGQINTVGLNNGEKLL